MKQTNPLHGYRPLATGYFCVPRKLIIKFLRQGVSPTTIGYLVIFVLATDWDSDPFRHGLIRYSLSELSERLNLENGTLSKQRKTLEALGLMDREPIHKLSRVINFQSFTKKGADSSELKRCSDEELIEIFELNQKLEDKYGSSFSFPYKNGYQGSSNKGSSPDDDERLMLEAITETLNKNIKNRPP